MTEPVRLTAEQRFVRAKWLVQTFQLERYVYIGLSTAAVAILLTMAVLQGSKTASWEGMLMILGPAGVLTGVLTRMFNVWNKTVEVLIGTKQEGDGA